MSLGSCWVGGDTNPKLAKKENINDSWSTEVEYCSMCFSQISFTIFFFLSLCIFGSIVILLFHIESLRSISRLVLRTRIADSVYRDDGNACNQKL